MLVLDKAIDNIVRPYLGATTTMLLEDTAKRSLSKPLSKITKDDLEKFAAALEKEVNLILRSAPKAKEVKDKVVALKTKSFYSKG